MYRHKSVLILNPKEYDRTNYYNDFADFNTKMIAKSFLDSHVFYFYDSVLAEGIENTEIRIKNLIRENRISIVFFAAHGTDYELSVEFFRSLRDELNVKNVLWVLDDEMIFDTLSKYYAQVFDAVITTDYYATFAYRKLGIPSLYFFSSYSKTDFYPVNVDKDIDVSFLGDCTKADRMDYISYLRENGIKAETFGKGSGTGPVKKEDIPGIFSRSKINLNFTKVHGFALHAWFLEDNTLTNLTRQAKGRPMQVAMTNSFCLSEYSPSLSATFEIGKEIDVFYDKADLLEKVRYYFRNKDKRAQIANSAYKKAVTIYEADRFMPKMMEELCEVMSKHTYIQRSSVIYKDAVFKKNHINKLVSIMFYQLLKLRFKYASETFMNLFQYGLGVFLVSFLKGTKRGVLKVHYEIGKHLQDFFGRERVA